MSSVAALQEEMVASRAVLLGVTTPLSDLALPSATTGPVLAIVTTHVGTLSADTAPGASVRGGGSTMLWISGSVAQVNAKLATLTYATSTPGTDQLTITLLDTRGTLSTAVQTPLSILPLVAAATMPSASVVLDQGTLTLDTRTLDGPTIALSENAGSQTATTAILINTTIGARSSLSFRNDNPAGGVMPRLAIAGRVEFDGGSSFVGNATAISLAQGATFYNEGTMSITQHAALFTGAGKLVNDGVIQLTGDGTDMPIRITTQVSGTGQIALTGGASLSLEAAVASTETITLGTGANTLHLSQPATFAGVISGLSVGETIKLDGVSVTSGFYSATGADTGTLELFNGQATVADLHLDATESGGVFQFAADSSGTTITLARPAAVTTTAEAEVYRFFDATHGTQLLTQDATERDTILGTRPDLHFEGIAFQAIQPQQADTSAVAIYRFFDTTNGTHFMTASATERDTLLGSRPDLVFEPGSTMFEHATAQAGDVAVYRFFDQNSGAHFFTSNVSERANILATRPDMTMEGVAFYAPAA